MKINLIQGIPQSITLDIMTISRDGWDVHVTIHGAHPRKAFDEYGEVTLAGLLAQDELTQLLGDERASNWWRALVQGLTYDEAARPDPGMSDEELDEAMRAILAPEPIEMLVDPSVLADIHVHGIADADHEEELLDDVMLTAEAEAAGDVDVVEDMDFSPRYYRPVPTWAPYDLGHFNFNPDYTL